MTLSPPIRYTDDVETIEDDEAETIANLNDTFDTILDTTSADYGRAVRSVHAKSHGVLEGVLTIDAGLPPELAQGIFAKPGEHRAIVRLSVNAGDVLDDAISLPRGLALKILDVEGTRLPGAEGTTQDFVMVNGKVFQAKNAQKFLGSLKLVAKSTDKAEGAKIAFSAVMRGVSAALGAIGIESATVNTLGGAPNSEPLGETYFSVTPFRYGDHMAKFQMRPTAPAMTALTGKTIDAKGDHDAIRHAVQTEAKTIDMVWEFRVQLCRDLEKQPIEDPTVEWKKDEAPFLRVGEVRVPAQDSWSPDRVAGIDEGLRFSVWTGVDAHRPLGNINRARRDTYQHSADFRARFNGCPLHEPA